MSVMNKGAWDMGYFLERHHMAEGGAFFIAADAFCRARREFLDINKRMKGAMARCNFERSMGDEYNPECCHWNYESFNDISEWCDECRPHYGDAHRRNELAPKFAGLMRKMLVAWRAWVES